MPAKYCDCTDPGCPEHLDHVCSNRATEVLYRIDTDDWDGTWMCEHCASDAMDSGVYTTSAPSQPRPTY